MQSPSSQTKNEREDPKNVGSLSFDCLKIVPLDNKVLNESNDKEEDKSTLNHPFFSIFLGPSRSGKTTAWMNMLKNPRLLYKKFDEVYFFVPTWNEDPIYAKNIKIEKEFIITDYSPDFFERMLERRRIILEAHMREKGDDFEVDDILPKTLIIVDDNIGNRHLSGRMWTMMDTLATRGRKFNMSVILTIQYLRGVTSRVVRGNATDVFIFFLPDADEQKVVLSEFTGSITKEDIFAMYRRCFQSSDDKWNFFYVQNFNTNNYTKFKKNLNTILIPPSLLQDFNKDHQGTEWVAEVAQKAGQEKRVQTHRSQSTPQPRKGVLRQRLPIKTVRTSRQPGGI